MLVRQSLVQLHPATGAWGIGCSASCYPLSSVPLYGQHGRCWSLGQQRHEKPHCGKPHEQANRGRLESRAQVPSHGSFRCILVPSTYSQHNVRAEHQSSGHLHHQNTASAMALKCSPQHNEEVMAGETE